MPDNFAISVSHVSKDFLLPQEKTNSLKSLFTGLFKGHSGKNLQHALKDISIEIEEGEFFGIVGRNGSGKSTLLKILAGIYQPSAGSVSTRGKLVPFIELGVGFNPELTGRENVYLNGAILGFSQKEIEAMYDDIVSFAELKPFMDQKLKNYSSGMQVRLAFSMATRADADILLIDEVLAVGDSDFQRKCYDYFKQLKRDKKTVVFVSHDMEAVREYCDRAILIEKNEIRTSGLSSKVAEEYAKLFNMSNDSSSGGNDEGRWGDKSAITKSIKVNVEKKKIVVEQEIKASQAVESPIIGFRIRDASGREVMGTNSKIERKTLPDMQSDKLLKLTWTLPNILSDGTYYIDPAVILSDNISVADWWDGAARFTIKKDRHLPYAIYPEYTLLVNGE